MQNVWTPKFAVFTVGLPEFSPAEAVTVVRDLGYDGIEWRVTDQQPAPDGAPGFWAGNRCTFPFATFVADAPGIRSLTESAGLALPAVGTYVECSDLAAVERAMLGTALLGAPRLRVNVPRYDGSEDSRQVRLRARTQYERVATLAIRHGVQALIEIHHGRLIPSASAAAAFLDGLDPTAVGVIYDPGNMVYEGHEQYRLGLETLGPYLAHVHLKNARWHTAGTRVDGSIDWEATWAPLSQGIVNLASLFTALRQVGYEGWLSFEDFSTDQPLPVRLRDNLAYARQLAASSGR